jgi:hemerythrin-like domain-containing protein
VSLRDRAAWELLLREHQALRSFIQRTRAAAETGSAQNLRACVDALGAALLAHLADEERILLPVLESMPAWGSLRTGLLRAEHAQQRALLTVLASELPHVLVGRALALCGDLLADMEFEERELFSALLGDAP